MSSCRFPSSGNSRKSSYVSRVRSVFGGMASSPSMGESCLLPREATVRTGCRLFFGLFRTIVIRAGEYLREVVQQAFSNNFPVAGRHPPAAQTTVASSGRIWDARHGDGQGKPGHRHVFAPHVTSCRERRRVLAMLVAPDRGNSDGQENCYCT